MLNFAAQCARDTRLVADDLRVGGMHDDAGTCDRLADQITRAQHFELPENGSLFDDELRGLCGLALRLPYPTITVEYIARHPTDGILRRMGLAQEIERDGERFVRIVAFTRDEGRWTPVPVAVELSSREWERIDTGAQPFHEYIDDPELCPPTPPRYCFRPEPILHGVLAGTARDRRDIAQIIVAATAVAEATLEMLEALACANVRAEVQERIDPKVNARRIRAGKLPLWETKILTVVCPRAPIHRTGTASDRASPRQHLRRGHVRHLLDGRRTWIQPAIVGDPKNGAIRKFYSVRTAA